MDMDMFMHAYEHVLDASEMKRCIAKYKKHMTIKHFCNDQVPFPRSVSRTCISHACSTLHVAYR